MKWLLSTITIVLFLSVMLIPVHAEVTSLSTNSKFYKGGSSIVFSGTILPTDSNTVTIVIFDPNNKFVTLTSAFADNTHTFQTSFDTGSNSNQHLLTMKGLYNATAFVATQANGKTVSFAFSPDGSAVISPPPTNLTATAVSPTEIDLHWLAPKANNGFPVTGYKIDRNDGSGFNPLATTQSTTYKDISLLPNSEHSYRVFAVTSAGTSDPSNIPVLFTLSSPSQPYVPTQSPSPSTAPSNTPSTTVNPAPTQSFEDLLKQRIEQAQKLQQMLNSQQNPPPSSPNTGTKSNQSQTTPSQPSSPPFVANTTIQSNTTPTPSQSSTNQTVSQIDNSTSKSLEIAKPSVEFNVKGVIYPVIAMIGAAIVGAILYMRKKRQGTSIPKPTDTPKPAPPAEPQKIEKDDDYAMMVLKNRLARGDITIEEFQKLKDELLEP